MWIIFSTVCKSGFRSFWIVLFGSYLVTYYWNSATTLNINQPVCNRSTSFLLSSLVPQTYIYVICNEDIVILGSLFVGGDVIKSGLGNNREVLWPIIWLLSVIHWLGGRCMTAFCISYNLWVPSDPYSPVRAADFIWLLSFSILIVTWNRNSENGFNCQFWVETPPMLSYEYMCA